MLYLVNLRQFACILVIMSFIFYKGFIMNQENHALPTETTLLQKTGKDLQNECHILEEKLASKKEQLSKRNNGVDYLVSASGRSISGF